MLSNIYKSFISKINNILIPPKIPLGRWNLKNCNTHFINPDPGYPNYYGKYN